MCWRKAIRCHLENASFQASADAAVFDLGDTGNDEAMKLNARALPRLAVTLAFGLGMIACSTDETVYDDDPIDGTADITVDSGGVDDGTDGGLDLDEGNVPGSDADDDLDSSDAGAGE